MYTHKMTLTQTNTIQDMVESYYTGYGGKLLYSTWWKVAFCALYEHISFVIVLCLHVSNFVYVMSYLN